MRRRVGWLGVVAGFLALAAAGLTSQDAQMVRAAYLGMELTGWFVIVHRPPSSCCCTCSQLPLYRYAVERGDELQSIPCLCGCGRFGHKSNPDCHVKAVNRDGALTFTSHAAT